MATFHGLFPFFASPSARSMRPTSHRENHTAAASPDAITAANAGRVQARLVLQGANIPATAEAEAELHRRGVLVVPDFIANAGGVICAAVEWAGGSETQAFAAIEDRIRRNTLDVLRRAGSENCQPRAAADAIALERVREADGFRRFSSSAGPAMPT